MDSTASGTALGTTTIFAGSSAAERRLERYELQSMARAGLPGERVAGCLRTVVQGAGGPSVWREVERRRAKYGGLMVCGSVWHCPVCAAAIAERRREDLAGLVDKARALGYRVALCSLTFSHGPSDRLIDGLGALLQSYRRLTELKAYHASRSEAGFSGSVKSLEVTWGPSNGWHPHIHLLAFLNPGGGSVEQFETTLRSNWRRALFSHGMMASNSRAVRVTIAGDEVADYISKYGHEPAHKVWTASDEMTKAHSKRAGKVKDGEQRYTPFDFLRWAVETHEERPMALFREYAVAFKGRHQLQYSRGLKERFALDAPISDQAAAEWIDEDAVLLATLDAHQWKLVNYYGLRGVLLEVAGAEGSKGLESLLASLEQL